jgi:hypothetical protein
MKTPVYLASYKGTHAGVPGIVNIGIRTLDRSIYSHTELAIGNPLESAVECFSSSGVDHGVRVKVMQLVRRRPWSARQSHAAQPRKVGCAAPPPGRCRGGAHQIALAMSAQHVGA